MSEKVVQSNVKTAHGINLCNELKDTALTEPFNGFTHETFNFLRKLRDHNNKTWFELHKSAYQEQVLQPLQALASGLGSFMLSIDPEIEVTPTVHKAISRVFRDTRFSSDKSPYKTSHWITFKRPRKDWQNFPAFFFEISPDSYRYGMGFFSADRETMDRFRRLVDSNPVAFLASISFYSKQCDFVIEGTEYKRSLKTDIPMELLVWYNRKSLYLANNLTVGEAGIDAHLIADLKRGFETLTPLYHYLSRAASQAG